MPIPNGEISFKPRTLLRVDGNILETSRFTPSDLRDFIEVHSPLITSHVEHLHEQALNTARRPELKERPVIQIARLGLYLWDRSVFSSVNPQEIGKVVTTPNLLLPDAREYWEAVEETDFQPEVHFRGDKATEGTNGIWLSLKTTKS